MIKSYLKIRYKGGKPKIKTTTKVVPSKRIYNRKHERRKNKNISGYGRTACSGRRISQ